jgi:hypothetical protein
MQSGMPVSPSLGGVPLNLGVPEGVFGAGTIFSELPGQLRREKIIRKALVACHMPPLGVAISRGLLSSHPPGRHAGAIQLSKHRREQPRSSPPSAL